MGNELTRPLIVVKKIKKVAGGHHSGTWKIAYADFVTAMMAFFLLMWLLGNVDGGTLNGISEYFKTPMKVALQGGSRTGDSSVVIQGGGLDLLSKEGQTARADAPPGQESKSDKEEKYKNFSENAKKAVIEQARKQEKKMLYDLKEKLMQQLQNSPRLNRYKNQFKIDVMDEGLRVILSDEENRPMFRVASSEMEQFAQEFLRAIAPSFNELPNTISISGHTDATPFPAGNKSYSNWELSSERANAARRVLIAGGLNENHMLRVTGLSSAVPIDAENPHNPINRRISIILLTKDAEQRVRNEGRLKTTSVSPYDPEENEDQMSQETPQIVPPIVPPTASPPKATGEQKSSMNPSPAANGTNAPSAKEVEIAMKEVQKEKTMEVKSSSKLNANSDNRANSKANNNTNSSVANKPQTPSNSKIQLQPIINLPPVGPKSQP